MIRRAAAEQLARDILGAFRPWGVDVDQHVPVVANIIMLQVDTDEQRQVAESLDAKIATLKFIDTVTKDAGK